VDTPFPVAYLDLNFGTGLNKSDRPNETPLQGYSFLTFLRVYFSYYRPKRKNIRPVRNRNFFENFRQFPTPKKWRFYPFTRRTVRVPQPKFYVRKNGFPDKSVSFLRGRRISFTPTIYTPQLLRIPRTRYIRIRVYIIHVRHVGWKRARIYYIARPLNPATTRDVR